MNYKNENGTLTVYLEKRIDSYTVDAVDKEISEIIASNSAEKFIADCKGLEFIASAGLRILLKLGKMYSDLTGVYQDLRQSNSQNFHLSGATAPAVSPKVNENSERLAKLESLRSQGLITNEEYFKAVSKE